MLHLVKYRKLFIILSLIVIIPGTLSLIIYKLNVGIDFAGGTNIEIRPQTKMDPTQLQTMLAPLNLRDLQIVTGSNDKIVSAKTVWVTLNTQIDSNVEKALRSAITAQYPKAVFEVSSIPATGNAKAHTMVAISGFDNVPQPSAIQALLRNLPQTSDPSKGPPAASATPTPVATAQPTAKAGSTPQPTAQPTAKAGSTPQPTAQPTAKANSTPPVTATPVAPAAIANPNNPANIAVSVVDVKAGQTTQTITLLTSSTIITVAENKSQIDVPHIRAIILQAGGPNFSLISSSEVGPSVAGETTRNAILAVIAASIFILIYIWFSFRKLPKAWRYGSCAIIAMLHDVLVVLGIFSILGHFFDIQIDALFITALLTVVGFSVHDTIVVFDRIRENLHRRTIESFEEVVNASLVQTMARSLNTSLTVLFTLLALTLFTGIGTSIHTFTLTLLIGIFSGTYSSIFNASMLLVMWEKGEWGFGFLGGGNQESTTVRREARELVRSR